MRFKRSLVLGAAVTCLLLEGCRRGPGARDVEGRSLLLAHVHKLASEIGPRPAGSPGDRAAQDYILKKMTETGLQARTEQFDRVLLSPGTEVVVSTANVVGILPGGQVGTILVGTHHDSRNAACPGASDDASGVAVVLEAARILARRSHRHMLVFASFGGEETFGLPGSREFVRRWDGPPIRLAITLDFVGTGRVFVAPFPTSPELWANRLLRQAEREARTGRVSFDPWLTIVPRLVPFDFGADHESFLEKRIPALNLSCQFPDWTYHTSEDQPGRVDGNTLLSARDLVVRMVEGADARGPSTIDTDRGYLPLPLFGYPFFLSEPLLVIAAAAVALLGLATLVRFRRELASLSGIAEGLRGVLVSFPLAALAVSGPFLAEKALRGISKVRHPWYAHPGFHVTGAILALAFTLWLSLYLVRFLRPSTLSGAYLVPAVVLEGATAAACLASGRADLAFPFVAATGAMLLAGWSQYAIRRFALGILGAAPLLSFLSPTTYRMFLELSGVALPRFALELAAMALFLPWFLFLQHLACTPEALYARPGGPLFRPASGLALLFLAASAVSVNALRPSYDEGHRALVAVRERIDLQRRRAEATFSSLETLGPVRLAGLGDRALPDAEQARIRVPFPALDLPGLRVDVESPGGDEVLVRIHGAPQGAPRRISLRFRSGKRLQVESGGTWQSVKEYRRVVFPAGMDLDEVFHFRRGTSEPLVLEADISYDSDLLGLRPQAPFRTFRMESRVRFLKRLL